MTGIDPAPEQRVEYDICENEGSALQKAHLSIGCAEIVLDRINQEIEYLAVDKGHCVG